MRLTMLSLLISNNWARDTSTSCLMNIWNYRYVLPFPAKLGVLNHIFIFLNYIIFMKDDGRCGEPTGVLNKLHVWIWHNPKPQKGASIVMPNKLHAWIGTASAAEVGKMQYSCFSFNVYVQKEAVTGSSCSRGLQCHAPSPEKCLSTLFCHCI
jgi:hypothetical protein